MIDQAFFLRRIAHRHARPATARTLLLIGAEQGAGTSTVAKALAARLNGSLRTVAWTAGGGWSVDAPHPSHCAESVTILDAGTVGQEVAAIPPQAWMWLVGLTSDEGLLAVYSALKLLTGAAFPPQLEVLWNRAASPAKAHAAHARLRRACGRFLDRSVPMAGWLAWSGEELPVNEGDDADAAASRFCDGSLSRLCQRLQRAESYAHHTTTVAIRQEGAA